MPALGFNFDASRVQPAEPGGNIWEGVVPMRIDRTEVGETAAKDGSKYLALHVTAMAGEYVSQSNVIRLNLWNKSPQAVEIAQRTLSSICHCSGRMTLHDSDQLNGAMLLGVWSKGSRTVTDQQTGMSKEIPNCDCKDYRMPDGRTIKEAMGGQPAAAPYDPNARQPAPQTNSPSQSMPMGGQAPGFQPAGAPNPHSAQPGPTGGFASGAGNAPGQGGAQPGPMGMATSTAASPYSAPGGPQPNGGGYPPPGGAPAGPIGGFAPQPPSGPGPNGQAFPQAQGPGGFGGAPQSQEQPQQYAPAQPQYQPQGQQPQAQQGGFPGPGGAPASGPWGR